MKVTTLAAIQTCGPCNAGWNKLITDLGPNFGYHTPLPFERILESNGIADAIWAMRTAPQYGREFRQYMLNELDLVTKEGRSDGLTHLLELASGYVDGNVSLRDLHHWQSIQMYGDEAVKAGKYHQPFCNAIMWIACLQERMLSEAYAEIRYIGTVLHKVKGRSALLEFYDKLQAEQTGRLLEVFRS